jgi:predicted RNA-binding protein with PUA-like domain
MTTEQRLTWLFQANPDRFDLDSYLNAEANLTWTARQGYKKMNLGDRVFIWRASGIISKSISGIVASGEITELPKRRPEDAVAVQYWKKGTPPEDELRVRLEINKVANRNQLLKRDWLKEDPILRDLPTIRFSNATNFIVNQHLVPRLEQVWSTNGDAWNRDEVIAGLWVYQQNFGKSKSDVFDPVVSDVALKIGRSTTAVSNRILDFVAIDPRYPSKENVLGSKTDVEVWNEFYNKKTKEIDSERLNREFNLLWGNAPGYEPQREDNDNIVLRIENPVSVLNALKEFDALGREEFLDKYGFGEAKNYFILYENKVYDSKAIAGVARGIEHPELGALTPKEFSGGENRVAKLIRRLGFTIVKEIPSELDAPLVLVQNERTVGARFDFWDDSTGERYHYPNSYKNKIREGRRFIYYKGSRRLDGTKMTPEYFGWGVIGEIYPDPESKDLKKKSDHRWICGIAEYSPFKKSVPFKVGGVPFENIVNN